MLALPKPGCRKKWTKLRNKSSKSLEINKKIKKKMAFRSCKIKAEETVIQGKINKTRTR